MPKKTKEEFAAKRKKMLEYYNKNKTTKSELDQILASYEEERRGKKSF